jgi:serine phosphatase RsbU (regulator of sigma subunit)
MPGPILAARRLPLSIPIAIKFAVFMTVLVLLFMAWQGVTALHVALEHQDQAVNESGIKDVTALASSIDPAWIEDPKLIGRLTEFLQRYCAATRELGVLNAVVYSGGGNPLATGKSGQQTINISQQQTKVDFPPAEKEGVEIQELSMDGQPTRRFSRSIDAFRGGQGVPIGRVEVLLSAQRISDSRDAMRDRMMVVSAVSACLGAVVAFLLASFLTNPIRTLAKDLRQVSLGNLAHQSRVRSGDEIGDLARTFNQMTANLQKAQEVVVAQKSLEHELNLATRIQTRLLPSHIPQVPGFEIAAYYRAAREVGGDYYDFIQIDPENLGMVVADVSGKGVPGSLVMTMTRSLLRMAATGQDSPAETIRQVNRILAPDVNPGMFVTLLYFVLHIPSRRVRLVRSGHNAPILYISRLQKLVHLQPRGIALGLDARGPLFDAELEVQQFTLKPGDFLVAYTDGIVEGKDPRGECYSDERFARVIQEKAQGSAQATIDAVIEDLQSHRMSAEQSDDITLLVLKSV